MNTTRHPSPPWRIDPAVFDTLARDDVPLRDDPVVFGEAAEDAVSQARAVLEVGWQRWLVQHPVQPAPALVTAQPRVTLVGDRPETYHLVALIRFGFTAGGREFRGYARGPAAAPMFAVERVPDPAESAAAGRHRWRRRTRRSRQL